MRYSSEEGRDIMKFSLEIPTSQSTNIPTVDSVRGGLRTGTITVRDTQIVSTELQSSVFYEIVNKNK